MKTLRMTLVAAIVTLVAPLAARADVVTFDDITTGTFAPVPDGYHGLNWNNFGVLQYQADGPSGYQNGVVSPDYVAFNEFGTQAITSSGTPFTIDSGYFTGAWNDGLTIDVKGFLNNVQVGESIFVVDTQGPSFQSFNFGSVDTVTFDSFGGVNHGYNGNGTQFAMDNLSINGGNSVPEPGSLALVGIGFAATLVFHRRKRAAKVS